MENNTLMKGEIILQKQVLMKLQNLIKKCSDCGLHPDYIEVLNSAQYCELNQELIDYICNIILSKKYIWEIKFDHLRILLLNPSAQKYDLKQFYYDRIMKSRRLAIKVFFIRGYSLYVDESDVKIVVDKFIRNMRKIHDYIDYEFILSEAGLPYLVKTYGYTCFVDALAIAKEEYQKIDPLLKNYFTINENLEQVSLLSNEEVVNRTQKFIEKLKKRNSGNSM